MIDITTIKDLRAAIDQCMVVCAQIRFGNSEKWVKISKKEAREFISRLNDDDSPKDLEMFGNNFGTLEDGVLYLG